MIAPIFAPVIMSAAITSVYAVIAPWIPVTVVPTSFATVAMETFITDVSSVIRNWPAASVSSTTIGPLVRPAVLSPDATSAILTGSSDADETLPMCGAPSARSPAATDSAPNPGKPGVELNAAHDTEGHRRDRRDDREDVIRRGGLGYGKYGREP